MRGVPGRCATWAQVAAQCVAFNARHEVADVLRRVAVAGQIEIDDRNPLVAHQHLFGRKVAVDRVAHGRRGSQLRPEPLRQRVRPSGQLRAYEPELPSPGDQTGSFGLSRPVRESLGVLCVQNRERRAGRDRRPPVKCYGDVDGELNKRATGQPLEGEQATALRTAEESRDPQRSA